MRKRLFIGIGVKGSLKFQIAKWSLKYKSKLEVRWIPDRNLHITLIPPWYEEEIQLTELTKRLSELRLNIKPFKINFEKIEFGPDPKRPRLVWAVGRKPDEIHKLENELRFALNKKPQRKSDFIHLTLARFKPRDFLKFAAKKLEEKINWQQEVNSICLLESKLSSSSAEYTFLVKIKLEDK